MDVGWAFQGIPLHIVDKLKYLCDSVPTLMISLKQVNSVLYAWKNMQLEKP